MPGNYAINSGVVVMWMQFSSMCLMYFEGVYGILPIRNCKVAIKHPIIERLFALTFNRDTYAHRLSDVIIACNASSFFHTPARSIHS
jgi:hypothetical protein